MALSCQESLAGLFVFAEILSIWFDDSTKELYVEKTRNYKAREELKNRPNFLFPSSLLSFFQEKKERKKGGSSKNKTGMLLLGWLENGRK